MRSWVPRALSDIGLERRALILLNTPLHEDLLRASWERSRLRICADGAADKLLAMALPSFKPDLICGDLDSVGASTMQHYSALGVEVIGMRNDQDTTDLSKALNEASRRGCDEAVVLGQFSGLGGRLDHTFGIIQSLFLAQAPLGPFRKVLCVSNEATMQLLLPESGPKQTIESVEGCSCGLVPIAGTCNEVTTTGLAWDLTKDRLGFGGLVSTSNQVALDEVVVTSDNPLLWTMAFPAAGPAT